MKITLLFAVFTMLCIASVHAQNIDTPSDVAAPPEDAVCTESGLCSKVIAAGTGDQHPDPWDSVTVHYSGWTTDGKLLQPLHNYPA